MELHADFLIIGSGIAALRAAIALGDAGDVLVLTKGGADDSNTAFAQGGIAAAIGPDDSPERHAEDTLAAGDGLSDPAAVAVLVCDGLSAVRELVDWGARFDREPDGRLGLAREGAHSVARVVHARDATGREISRVLWTRTGEVGAVRLVDHAQAVGVLIRDGRSIGVQFADESGSIHVALAEATLLATGGAGQVYRETTNPHVAAGDGIALAYRAGAAVCDLEFVQFHPTALESPGAPRYLLSEALRGEGARLVNAVGDRFMGRYEAQGELAPRDRVARAIIREREMTGGAVYLLMDHLPADYVHARFPGIAAACRQAGFDLARDPVPVGPAAHYVMGGIETDLEGRTSIPGLFAAGEVACTKVHGANRLASNSLLEGLVFGARAGTAMRAWRSRAAADWPVRPAALLDGPPPRPSAEVALEEAALRDLMWMDVGLFRDARGLGRALSLLDAAWDSALDPVAARNPHRWREANLVAVGRLIARAALRREESRGAHFRSDFPRRDDIHWKRHVSEVVTD